MDWYTNVSVVGNSIGLRGVERGKRVTRKVAFNPTLYLISKEPTNFQTFDGKHYLEPFRPGNIWETKEYLKKARDVDDFRIFGNPRPEYAFISENFPVDIPFDASLIYVANIDIEVNSENGFPYPAQAAEPVLSITVEVNGTYHVWGMMEYIPHIPNVKYYKCRDEMELLASFLNFWTSDYPDVVTGWNIQTFDIPYLLHRITNLFGAEKAKSMSPWGRLTQGTVTQFNRDHTVYYLQGLDILDYEDLFKKFSRNAAQESYKLGDIAQVVTGDTKLKYEYGETFKFLSGSRHVIVDEKKPRNELHQFEKLALLRQRLKLEKEKRSTTIYNSQDFQLLNVDSLLDSDLTLLSDNEISSLLNEVEFQCDRECYSVAIQYNIHDTTLIRKIDAKEKLLDLAFTLAYQSKTNPSDVFQQVRMWTQITDDDLYRDNKFATAQRHSDIDKEKFEGAFVKDSFSGMFEWVASFDATSLYPSLIMQHNISPETFVEPETYHEEVRAMMSQSIGVDALFRRAINTDILKKHNLTLTANGHLFRTDKKGFLPHIIEKMFANRQAAKKKMLAAEKLVESLAATPASDPQLLTQAKNDAARYDALQNAIKVCLNSAYGALGNQYFIYFDVRLAEAVTITGKLSNKWATRAVNEYLNRVLKTDRDYVIAGDTDSLYVHLGPLLKKVYEDQKIETATGIDFMDKLCGTLKNPGPLGKVLVDAFDEFAVYLNVLRQMIYFKREALADRAIWTGGKKRYVINVWNSEGVQYAEAKIKIKGFEMVKSSHPKLAREKMKDAVKIILNKSEPDLWKFIADFKKDFMSLPVETIAFPRGCHDFLKYKGRGKDIYASGTPQHQKAALIYNHLIETKELTKTHQLIADGEKIKYVALKKPNPIHEEVVAFPYIMPPELGLHEYVDYDEMFEKTFIKPLKIILDAIGWKVKKEVSLKSLFKR